MSSSSAAGNSIRPLIASSQPITPSFGIRIRIAPSSSYALPSATSRAASVRQRSAPSSWKRVSPSHSIPSQRSDSSICPTASATSRLVSVFSIRSRHSPPLAAREEPVEQERAHPSDVEEAGRARCHADADGHQAGIVGATVCSAAGARSARTDGSDRISAPGRQHHAEREPQRLVTPIASESGPDDREPDRHQHERAERRRRS